MTKLIQELENQIQKLSIIETSITQQTSKINEIDSIINGIDVKSTELFERCNEILKRKNEEEKRLEEINREIRYYDAFNELAIKFTNPKSIEYQSKEFEEDYKEICRCIEYFQERKNDVVNYTYLLKYQQLKSKILSYLSIYIKKQIEYLHMNVQLKNVVPLKDFTQSDLYINSEDMSNPNPNINKNALKLKEINEIITSINSTKGIIESSYFDSNIFNKLY